MAIITLQNSEGLRVTFDDTIYLGKKGGEGKVYPVKSPHIFTHLCVKIYHDSILNNPAHLNQRKEKIEYLLKKNVVSSNDAVLLAWPQDLVYNSSGTFVGFLMPKAFPGSEELQWFVTYDLRKRILEKPGFEIFDGSRSGLKAILNRMKLVNTIAYAINLIHEKGDYTLVDCKPKNILVTAQGKISLVDLDSVQVVSNRNLLFKANASTAEYTPPEVYNNGVAQTLNEYWDSFSFAVIAYELIIGNHPYTGTYLPPYENSNETYQKIQSGLFVHGSKQAFLRDRNSGAISQIFERWNILPGDIKQLFVRAFEEGQYHPYRRPTMQEWGRVLQPSILALQGLVNG